MNILLCFEANPKSTLYQEWLESQFPAAKFQVHTDSVAALYLLETDNINLLVIHGTLLDKSIINASSLEAAIRTMAIVVIDNEEVPVDPDMETVSDERLLEKTLSPPTLYKACQSALLKRRASLVYPEAPTELKAFCSMLAHDVKAQSRHVRQLSRMLFEDINERLALDETDQESIILIEAATKNLDSFIDGIRYFLLVPSELTCIESTPVAMLLKEADKTYAAQNLTLDISPDCETLAIEGDPNLLQLMLNNLIDNAVKFSPDGPKVTVGAALCQGKRCLEISVEDHGIGIQAKHQKNIFKPFCRLNNLQSYPGAGLGLATVNRIVNLHQGRVEVTSTKGSGSIFLATLPLTMTHTSPIDS